MDDALSLRIEKLFEHYMTFNNSYVGGEQDITESFDGLMNHLRDMMVDYENEQVLALLKQMEEAMVDIALDSHGEPLMSDVIQDNVFNDVDMLSNGGQSFMTQTRLKNFFNTLFKGRLDKMIVICEQLCNIRYNSNVEEEKTVVGFNYEIETLLDQLIGTSSTKQFQIITITGMAGLGKTTLARTLYNHELVKYTFDYRAWTCVSQVYLKKDLLLNILSSFIDNLTNDFYEMSEHHLGEKLYRKLKSRRYLVVLDDIWDCRVWNDLKMYFPDDKTGSRVLFTGREIDVSLHAQSARPAHVLRLRTTGESWCIFLKKVFRMGICPSGLFKSGWVINRKCEGLPLAIVIAAGLLKNNLSVTWWEQISASLRSFMVSDPRQYIDSLALSYNHLPPHLRPCFLFLRTFPEDYEIPVTKLTWLWIAQGFVHETESRILEDVAEEIFLDLIKRSLLMASRKKSDSKVKTCRIHDLLRDFCLRKAEEENFLSNNYRYGSLSSMLCFPLELGKSLQEDGSINTQSCHNICSRTPNLRKLGFCGPLMSSLGDLEFPNLGSLEKLQKLKLLNTCPYPEATRSCNPILFPENLRNLTLSNTGMGWEEMWSFSLLPNLETLKLKFQACVGEIWEIGDAEFRQLKVLKLHDLDIKQWVCSRDNFPRLQRLVVHRCLKLDSVPKDVGRVFTLEVIEVNGCSRSAYSSAVEIQKEQENEGNCYLKVHGKQNS